MTKRQLVTVYDVRCRVRVRMVGLAGNQIATAGPGGNLPHWAGSQISGGTWRNEDVAREHAAELADFDAYVMPLDIPSDLVDQVCDD